MSDDLVKRLRNEATSRQGLERFDTLEDEAADRIEALTAAPSPDVLDDPRVRELVKAAQEVHDDLLRRGLDKNDPETKTPYRQVSIGRSAWWGLCDALARITDTGGRKDG